MPNLPRGVTHRCSEDLYISISTRSIFIIGDITTETCSWVLPWLHRLDAAEKNDTIRIFISSPGGCYYSGQAIMDSIDRLKSPVQIIGTGFVASIAADIVAFGRKGSRAATPQAVFLFHSSSVEIESSTPEMFKSNANFEIKRAEEDLKKLAKVVGMPVTKLREKISSEWILTAKDALKHNIIDEVLK